MTFHALSKKRLVFFKKRLVFFKSSRLLNKNLHPMNLTAKSV